VREPRVRTTKMRATPIRHDVADRDGMRSSRDVSRVPWSCHGVNSPPPFAGAAAGCLGADPLPRLPGPNSTLSLGAGEAGGFDLGELTLVSRFFGAVVLSV
jgi:hypothetical protein